MGYYYVRHLSWKKSAPHWKLQFVSYKKSDLGESSAKKPKKEWDIDPERWAPLGFHARMSVEDAKARAKQLNLDLRAKEQEKLLLERKRQETSERLKLARWLPVEFVSEFESRFLRDRSSEGRTDQRQKPRAARVWRAAQRAIAATGVEPGEWFLHTYEIYDYFYRAHLSIKYVNVILKMMNLWGFFISRKLSQPFLPLPMPRGYERARLIENYYHTKKQVGRGSIPITPTQLDSEKKLLSGANYNWLFLSVWLGLRPQEIDNLKNEGMWRVEETLRGVSVLWVYQTKIIALPPEERWKPIPLLFAEQEIALKILMSGKFRRPIPKTMRKRFGEGITLYGGRKGFSDLMLSLGQKLENISVWMGHATLNRTWTSYKDKKRFHLNFA
ncbi:hypothetical protein EBR21_10565 [bacterium]|nr:hypothetical protein [bacterium]